MENKHGLFSPGNTISLETAVARTSLWRDVFSDVFNITDPSKIVRGFRIPIQDIKDLAGSIEGREIEFVRCYLCAQPNPSTVVGEPFIFEIILVPVEAETEKDVLSQRSGELVLSTIYDVTQPCPPCCDPSSPLYGSTQG